MESESVMQADFAGRVRNYRLERTKPLYPVFEAIANSLDAIDDLGTGKGKIVVELIRGQMGLFTRDGDGAQRTPLPVEGFTITDNGIGFTDANYVAFRTLDTSSKASRGGKGIGRLAWLKAFEAVEVQSVYKQGDKWMQREFGFCLPRNGIYDHSVKPLTGTHRRKTVVTLQGFRDPYKEICERKADAIASRVMEHCVVRFLAGTAPTVIVKDDHDTVDVGEQVRELAGTDWQRCELDAAGNTVRLLGVRFRSRRVAPHRIVFCANRRGVVTEKLEKHIADLAFPLKDDAGDEYVYIACVTGEVLDGGVTAERTDFDFFDGQLSEDGLTLDKITEIVLPEVKSYLGADLRGAREAKLSEVCDYIRTEAPQHRILAKRCLRSLEELPPNLDHHKLEMRLHEIQFREMQRVRARGQEILSKEGESAEERAAIRTEYEQYLHEENDFGRMALAEYIVHRKRILDLLRKTLALGPEGEYAVEEDVHAIVFPVRRTSDDVPYEDQNLWLVDERLSYHFFLASDIPLDKLPVGSFESRERGDILVFNTPLALTDQEGKPYPSVTILEFKRPQREGYPKDEDPIAQMYRYATRIREGKAKDEKGRDIPVSPATNFFAYLICDITPKVREYAQLHDLVVAPDGLGFFGYHNQYNVYVEVLAFDKLLQDAEKRNRVLFDKLGIV